MVEEGLFAGFFGVDIWVGADELWRVSLRDNRLVSCELVSVIEGGWRRGCDEMVVPGTWISPQCCSHIELIQRLYDKSISMKHAHCRAAGEQVDILQT